MREGEGYRYLWVSGFLSYLYWRHIQVALEIMNPVTGVRMPTEDLLRCQGRLLDNAIEASSKEEGKIRVVLLQDTVSRCPGCERGTLRDGRESERVSGEYL